MVIINVEDCLSAPCHSISSTLEVSLQFTEIIWLLTLFILFSDGHSSGVDRPSACNG